MLGRKKNNSNEEWKRAFDVADKLIPKTQAEDIVCEAVNRLKLELRGETPVCCWSGGKDAQVVRLIYELAGFDVFTMGSCREIEYPAFLKWVDENKPDGLEIYQADIDVRLFNRKPRLIFPETAADAYWYYQNINQQAWKKSAAKHGASCIVLGHRALDGNQKGKTWEVDGRPVRKVFPIWELTHEEIFAIIKHFDLPLAPFYGWKNGFVEGTHTVLARSGKAGKREAARDVCEIDPEILPRLAKKIPYINSLT